MGLRAKFPANPNSKRQRSQKGANIGDGLRGFEACDAPKPRHDKDRREEIQALTAHREQGGLPCVADVLEQHVGRSAHTHQWESNALPAQGLTTHTDELGVLAILALPNLESPL